MWFLGSMVSACGPFVSNTMLSGEERHGDGEKRLRYTRKPFKWHTKTMF